MSFVPQNLMLKSDDASVHNYHLQSYNHNHQQQSIQMHMFHQNQMTLADTQVHTPQHYNQRNQYNLPSLSSAPPHFQYGRTTNQANVWTPNDIERCKYTNTFVKNNQNNLFANNKRLRAPGMTQNTPSTYINHFLEKSKKTTRPIGQKIDEVNLMKENIALRTKNIKSNSKTSTRKQKTNETTPTNVTGLPPKSTKIKNKTDKKMKSDKSDVVCSSSIKKQTIQTQKQISCHRVEEFTTSQYHLIVPEIAGKNSASESGQLKRVVKKVTFSDEHNPMTDDPKYNCDLKRSDQTASLPLTKDEIEELMQLDNRINLVRMQWRGYDPVDPILEDDMYRFDQVHNHREYAGDVNHVNGEIGSVLTDFSRGRYPGYFSLPLMTELKLRFEEEIQLHNLKMAMARLSADQLEKLEEEPPEFLINWGVIPDNNAWNFRRSERKEDLVLKQNSTQPANKNQQSILNNKTNFLNENSSPSTSAVTMFNNNSFENSNLNSAQGCNNGLRPITKRSHLVVDSGKNLNADLKSLKLTTPMSSKAFRNNSPDSGFQASPSPQGDNKSRHIKKIQQHNVTFSA